jgi:hypothetical protein
MLATYTLAEFVLPNTDTDSDGKKLNSLGTILPQSQSQSYITGLTEEDGLEKNNYRILQMSTSNVTEADITANTRNGYAIESNDSKNLSN